MGGPPPCAGDGLSEVYFNNKDFTGSQVPRIDPAVDFNWGLNAPVPGIARDTFSVRWTGQVEAPFTETYTFTVQADDGVRLWVDDQLLIDGWADREGREALSGSKALTAGRKYNSSWITTRTEAAQRPVCSGKAPPFRRR